MTRATWLRLNADGLLIATLGLQNGLEVFDPESEKINVALGFVPLGFYAWTTLYVVGGLLMVVGFAVHKASWELLGRFFLVSAFIWETWRFATVYGLDSGIMTSKYFILSSLIATSALRVTALLPKTPLFVVIPGRAKTSEGGD